MNILKVFYHCLVSLLMVQPLFARAVTDTAYYSVQMDEAEKHEFGVTLKLKLPDKGEDQVRFSMPAWSPGYYQIMDYGDNVLSFHASDSDGDSLSWEKAGNNTWEIRGTGISEVNLKYSVKAERSFVASSYIDQDRAFIKPASMFMYMENNLAIPVQVHIRPAKSWNLVATGLDPIADKQHTYKSSDFDQLYDSPILVGKLKELSPFYVNDIPHRFIGYNMGSFDEALFIKDLQKIVECASKLIGEIPYAHYTFMAIGPGQGGIEQLNSTAFGFNGNSLLGAGRLKTLGFLAHEYFHHYNVKRIRPVELGPFDYSKANRSKQLWMAEGLTVYYENILLNRSGLITRREMLASWASTIQRYENNPGRLHQTLAESSDQTWKDGPFGNDSGEKKTISYYEKGPIIGMLLDLKIRTSTNNQKSLDDVMRTLYYEYYKKLGRGYTEAEIKEVCEKIAGTGLGDIFEYIYTTKAIDYPRFFSTAGLDFKFDKQKNKEDNNEIFVQMKVKENVDGFQKLIIDDLFRSLN